MNRKDNGIVKGLRQAAPVLCFIIVCTLLLSFGCTRMPSPQELAREREKSAREDVNASKPGTDINFEKPLTLEDVIKIGLQNNLEIRVAKLNEEIADKETLAEKLRMLPSLKAGGTYEYRDKLRKSDVYNWETDQDLPDKTVSELKDSMKADLTLTWNVLDTMLAYVRSGQKEMHEEILKMRRKRQEQQLALDITKAYWEAAAVEDALDYVHRVESNLKQLKAKIDQSVERRDLDKMDAADVELRLKELELTIRQLQANLSSSRLELSRLLGFNQNVQYTLARPPIKPIVAALPHTRDLDIDQLEEHALLNRPELFEKDIQILIQKDDAKNKMLSMFPGLSFFAATHYDENRLLLSNTWNSVGAGIGWELLDLPARYATYKGSQRAIEMAKVQRLMMTVGVITQVHIALLDYAIKVDRFRLLEETYQLASNLLNMAQQKNQAGKLPDISVTQRHLEEMAAKLRRDEAVVELMVAHKRLCVSTGMNPLDCDRAGLPISGSGLSENAYDYQETEAQKRWKCTECSYVHIGAQPPEVCPVCGADYGKFVEIPAAEYGLYGDVGNAASNLNEEDLETWGKNPQPVKFNDRLSRGVAPSPGWAGNASDQYLWKVQLGSFTEPGGPAKRIEKIKDLDLRLIDNRDARVSTVNVNGKLFNRVRVMGLTENEAQELARSLKQHGQEYWIVPPRSIYW